MADTQLAESLKVKKFLRDFYVEYVRDSGFKPYMGTGTSSCFQVKRELVPGGKSIGIPLITRLKGAGVTGYATLEGSEEALGNFEQEIAVDYLRNAVVIRDPDERYSNIGLMQAARDQLRSWAMDRLRTDIITGLGSIDGVAYGSATPTQKNTWQVNNADRVLFGDAVANDTGTHSTSLDAITDTMTMSADIVTLMKRIAKNADPHIRPTRVSNSMGREYFVCFMNSFAFRDLKEDPVMTAANREARERNVDTNPIFQDGDLIYDGVICREIPEIGSILNTAVPAVELSPVYLCGAQALGIAWGEEATVIRDTFDYGHRKGTGIREVRGIEKLRFNTGAGGESVDHGLVSAWVAAAGDVS